MSDKHPVQTPHAGPLSPRAQYLYISRSRTVTRRDVSPDNRPSKHPLPDSAASVVSTALFSGAVSVAPMGFWPVATFASPGATHRTNLWSGSVMRRPSFQYPTPAVPI